MGIISSSLKRMLHGVGIDVRLRRNIEKAQRREWEDKWCDYWRPFIAHRNIRTVIDIGANTGQFACLFHRLCPQARMISLEPLPGPYAELKKNLAEIPGAQAIQLAIGAKDGTAIMNETDFTPCSSMLKTTANMNREFGEGGRTREVPVPMMRLDDFMATIPVEDELMIKIDVQGYELEVIRGGLKTMRRAAIVATEVCFFPRLYEDQPLFDDLYKEMRGLGFSYMGNPEQLASGTDNRIVEAEAIFEKMS